MPPGIPSVLFMLVVGLLLAVSPAQEPVTSSPASQPATTQKSQSSTTQPSATTQPQKLILDLGKGVKMELVLIPAGKFMMGASEGEMSLRKNEGPQHLVTIRKPFYMGIYPVTREQYEAVMGVNPCDNKEDVHLPVEDVDWDDCQEFIFRLCVKTQKEARLPSEAEWEYACRAGTTTPYFFGSDPDQLSEYAWFGDNSDLKPHPVGLKKANPWGLYDMYGNVPQLCQDWYHRNIPDFYNGAPTDGSAWESPPGDRRVVRGGSSGQDAICCRSASRGKGFINKPTSNFQLGYGLRVVVEIPAAP